MNKDLSGFTLIELCVVIAIFAILLTIGGIAYKSYEARHRCHAVAQILLMDLKLQQQEARKMDDQRGILFVDKFTYRLGYSPSKASPYGDFEADIPPREVNITKEFSGVSFESIGGSTSFPNYVYFDPKAVAADGKTWVPYSTSFDSYPGVIELKTASISASINVWQNGEITIDYE